jgi:hypothetical protein
MHIMKDVNESRFGKKQPEIMAFKAEALEIPLPSTQHEDKNTDDTPVPQLPEQPVAPPRYRIEIPPERRKIRHTFDIFEDQLEALKWLQVAEREQGTKTPPKLGEMVQLAIDSYIKEKTRKLSNIEVIKEH